MRLLKRTVDWASTAGYSSVDMLLSVPSVCRFYLLWLRYPKRVSGGPASIRPGSDIRILKNGNLNIGVGVRILRDFTGRFYGVVSIGQNTFINRGCYIACREEVEIGSNCLIGEYVSIHDENHVISREERPLLDKGYTTSPIKIGNNVWIGAKATILPGVIIGSNAVVGANSVVTKSVPPNTVVAGAPARVLRAINYDDHK